MFLTPHVVAGVAIGSAIYNPVLAIPLAFLSHFFLDAVPHWDNIGLGLLEKYYKRVSAKTFRIILLDALVALSFVLFFVYWSLPDYGVAVTISFSALAAILPDVYYIPLAFFGKGWGWVMWVVKLQSKIQSSLKVPIAFGLSIQAFLIVVCLLVTHQQILVLLPQAWSIL